MSVLIFDYPGYGRSEGTPDEAGCHAAGEAAWPWLVTTQGLQPENIILFGKMGGPVARVVKEGQDHHPHGLKDPQPILEFFDKAWAARK